MHKIMIVGEAFGEEEERRGEPFVGASGYFLDSILRQVGIVRQDCFLTNVFNFRPPFNDLEYLMTDDTSKAYGGIIPYQLKPKLLLKKEYGHCIEELYASIRAFEPNVVIVLGNTPLWALAHKTSIAKYRGTPMLDVTGRFKLIPTYHPAAAIRNYKLRAVMVLDLQKAVRESLFPEVRRPARSIIYNPSLGDIEKFYQEEIVPAPIVSVDIETRDGQITEIGFAPRIDLALVIPFYSRQYGNYWPSVDHEFRAWQYVRKIMAEKRTIGQNFKYDMRYLWDTMRIPTNHFAGDTMLLHHSLQPELEKGLGFLGSVYTSEPAWKFMRQTSTSLKKEE